MKHSNKILDFFEENFNEKKCHDLCRQYKFIERSSSKIKGHEFIKTLVIPSDGMSTDSLKGLCKRMRQFNPKADLSAQALCERINDINSSRLMKGLFSDLLTKIHKRATVSCPKFAVGLEKFNRVLLQDSTVVSLNEKLESVYKGTRRGNNCVKSQVKIDLIHDMSKGLLVDAKIVNGNVPDQSLSGRIIDFIKPGDLVIRDLGYFSILTFQNISNIFAYFLSRFKAGVLFYLNNDDKEPIDIGEFLRKKRNLNINIFDINGYIGKEKTPGRLIIYRQTEDVTSRRLRDAKKDSRQKGETISKNKRLLLSFTILITNASKEMLPAQIAGTIYRIRWEVELVFKRWKSQLKIDFLKGIHKERIDCLIWSRLCTVIVLELVIGHFKIIINETFDVELSEVQLIQYMMRNNSFCMAVAKHHLEPFFKEMEKDIPRMLLKATRLRKTMRERVFQKESHYGMQQTENQNIA